MDKIKFGTDGWRAIIAKDFTVANVALVASAVAKWLTGKFQQPVAVLGYDCRFGGEMFMEAVAKILASKGVKIYIPDTFVTTPMVSLGVLRLKANCGIMITASHNAPVYNGIKLKGSHGGPMLQKDVTDIENLISSEYEFDLEMLNWNYLLEQGRIQYINLETIYIKNINDHYEISKITGSGKAFAFDAMYGSAQNVMKKLFPEIKHFHSEFNPSFNGIPPEPVHKNLHELAEFIWKNKNIECAFAVDGDGDRIALYNNEGNYIDSNRIILLMIYYYARYLDRKGKVLVDFTATSKIEVMCRHFNLDVERTMVGFKNISEAIVSQEDILIGGEESGGITVQSYIPERDGIWTGILIWSWLIDSGKSLKEMMDEVLKITGPVHYERMDIEVNRNIRNKVIQKCEQDGSRLFWNEQTVKTEKLDGFKYILNDSEWVLIRPSGTEPVLRIYAEAESTECVSELLNKVRDVIISIK
jgi:phosphomannomutase